MSYYHPNPLFRWAPGQPGTPKVSLLATDEVVQPARAAGHAGVRTPGKSLPVSAGDCQACAGHHRAHTCGKRKRRSAAAMAAEVIAILHLDSYSPDHDLPLEVRAILPVDTFRPYHALPLCAIAIPHFGTV